MDAQRSGADVLSDILTASNADCVWSDGTLKIVPYGDTAISGNGVGWSPDLDPIYDLTDDDFQAQPNADPVQRDVKRGADAYNAVEVEFLDRAQQYSADIAPARDQANIDAFGLRRPGPGVPARHLRRRCRRPRGPAPGPARLLRAAHLQLPARRALRPARSDGPGDPDQRPARPGAGAPDGGEGGGRRRYLLHRGGDAGRRSPRGALHPPVGWGLRLQLRRRSGFGRRSDPDQPAGRLRRAGAGQR